MNYDVKIGPKPGPRSVNKSGPVGLGLKCRPLKIAPRDLTITTDRYAFICTRQDYMPFVG